jgi:hypothetical protein
LPAAVETETFVPGMSAPEGSVICPCSMPVAAPAGAVV